MTPRKETLDNLYTFLSYVLYWLSWSKTQGICYCYFSKLIPSLWDKPCRWRCWWRQWNSVAAQSETAVRINISLWTNLAGDTAGDVSESCGSPVRDRCLYKHKFVDKPCRWRCWWRQWIRWRHSQRPLSMNISLWTNLAGDTAGDVSESCDSSVRVRRPYKYKSVDKPYRWRCWWRQWTPWRHSQRTSLMREQSQWWSCCWAPGTASSRSSLPSPQTWSLAQK